MTTLRNCLPPQAWIPALLLALACAGCAAPPANQPVDSPSNAAASRPKPAPAKEAAPPPKVVLPSKGEQELAKGIKSYEDGEYKAAAKELQSALDLGLDVKRDQATAHKYLAFIICKSARDKSCRDEFQKALDADPNFELAPAEAGHPIWGPALKSVKAERAAKPAAK